MVRKGYNWKARTVVKTVIDDTKTKKIQIQLNQTSTYDQCNALVLPSEKRETKIKHDKQQITRILTKKQRKNLEKIVEKKKKKENRASLLEALSKVQATPEERDQLTSIASVQTKGLKKYFQELRTERKPKRKHEEIEEVVLNSLSGSKRKRMSLLGSKVTQKNTDPNIVGLESESETSEEESDVEEAQKELSIELKKIPDEIDIGEDEEVDENELNLSNESENILAGELQIVETIKENPIIIVTDDTSEKEVEADVVPKIELKKNPEEVDIGEDVKVDEKVKFKLDNESEKIKLKQELKSKSNKKQQIRKTIKENPVILITDDTSEKELEELKKNPEEIDIGEDEVVDENKLNLNNEPEKIKPNEEIKSKSTLTLTSSAIFISVDRPKEIQKSRLKLPILAEEQQIMETINENPIILVAGETGSGKTTQVPQFLYEAGYAQTKMIAITEPRRVAAIAMSKRVGEEMNLPRQVSYLIRFEGNANDETKIKFMTDGVLLKELQSDFLLTKYSVIILDEAHERSVYTDILIGLLSRIVPLRIKKGDPLKLIIMSATLRLDDFISNKRLFKIAPPVIKVDARQYSVTVHFNKRTPEDYIKEAFQKVIKIHTKLPEGAILIFVTGQNEINRLVHKLRQAFPLKHKSKLFETLDESKKSTEISDSDSEIEENLSKTLKKSKKPILPQINLDDYSLPGNDSEVEEHEDLSDSEEHEQMLSNSQPLWTLPLYSLLPGYKQAKVFQPPPEGCRLCIVSTNVAETSLTIPNVKYVVDTGKSKSKLYDKVTGVTSYQVMWTSKASANQRAGRAGRTGPGHCYRLYSSAVFNDTFQEFAVPEIQQKPVDDLYLQMKCMNIDKVINFPFPSAPDLLQLKTAEHRLEILGAMKLGQVTPLGKAIAQFPVLPRFGKMLALSHQQNLLPYTICMVAALTVQEVLLETPIGVTSSDDIKALRHKWSLLRRKWAGHGHSSLLGDPMVLLRAVGAAEYANSDGKLEQFCRENGLRHKAVVEIRKLRMQLTNDIKINVPGCDICVDPKLKPPNDVQAKLLRQILLAGMGDQVAKKMDPEEFKEDEDKIKYKYAYRAMDMEDPVFLHSSSVLRKSQPTYVIYQEIYETNKLYMRGLTVIEPEWLPNYVPHLCNMGEPVTEPRYEPRDGRMYCSVSGTFGRQAWPLPMVDIEYPKSINMYKWFGRFLLEGKIFTKLEKYAVNLLSMPSTMVKSWAKLQPRTDAFLKALMSRDVNSKSKLEDIWRLQPQFLLHEYQKWLPESGHNEVSLLWPPVDSVL